MSVLWAAVSLTMQKTGQYATKPGSAYNLDELQKRRGLHALDSFRITPAFNLNYGLRWDFTETITT